MMTMKHRTKEDEQRYDLTQNKNYDDALDSDKKEEGRLEGLNIYEQEYKNRRD
jgi:hypothetical protein